MRGKRLVRSGRLFAAVIVALVVVGQSLSALADVEDKDEARLHFDNGIALISQEPKDYAAAVVEFQTSVRLFPTKSGLYNLGLCYRRLSRYGEALETLARLEREFGDSMSQKLRTDVEWEVTAIRRLTVELKIEVSQPGATIRLGGDVIGTSPLEKPLILGPREYRLEVELAGFEPVRRRLVLAAGQRHVETVELTLLSARLMVTTLGELGADILVDGKKVGVTPLAAPVSIPPGQHVVSVAKEGYDASTPQAIFLQGGGAATLTFQLSPTVVTPEEKPEEPWKMPRTVPWVGVGLTAAAGVAAGVLWYHADQRHDDFESADDLVASGQIWEGHYRQGSVDASRQAAADDADKLGAAAIGTAIGAGVLAAATAILFVVAHGEDDEADRGVAAGPGGLVVSF